MKRKDTGQIRIIEAFLAVAIIFSSFTISANLTVTQNITKYDKLTSNGLQALLKLDSDGSLGEQIGNEDWSSLRDTLSLVLPVGTIFNLTVFDEQMKQANTEVISNGGFSSEERAFVEYVCVSRNSTLHYYVIHMCLAAGA